MNDRLTQPGMPELSPAPPARRSRSRSREISEFNEYEAAQIFKAKEPPIMCVEEDWYKYREGQWHRESRALSMKSALEVMEPSIREERRASRILKHVEGEQQVPPSKLLGFYMHDGGAVLINCANGVVRVSGRHVELLPHSPDYCFTLKASARYDETAECPLFIRTLEESIPEPEDRALFQMFCGTLLIPDARFEAALVLYGLAGAGKSSLADAVASTLSGPLVSRLTMKQLTSPNGYFVPMLQRAALNLGTELDSVGVDDGGAFKALCSGEILTAREIYGRPDQMKTSAKMMFLANDLPRFNNGTDGELRRMRFIRMDQLPAVRDVSRKEKLPYERDGIFNWMIAGMMQALIAGRLPEGSNRSRSTLARFAISNDPIAAFVNSRCELCAEGEEPKETVRQAYVAFLAENGLAASLEATFFKKLYERFPTLKQTRPTTPAGRINAIAGLRLLSHESAES